MDCIMRGRMGRVQSHKGVSAKQSPGRLQFAPRRDRSDYSRANHAEEIRDVEDNVPPRQNG
jgi:hypothetical protein